MLLCTIAELEGRDTQSLSPLDLLSLRAEKCPNRRAKLKVFRSDCLPLKSQVHHVFNPRSILWWVGHQVTPVPDSSGADSVPSSITHVTAVYGPREYYEPVIMTTSTFNSATINSYLKYDRIVQPRRVCARRLFLLPSVLSVHELP